MILDIDVGNSRLKWLLRAMDNKPVSRGSVSCGQWTDGSIVLDEIVSRVRISSVKGDMDADLTNFCQRKLGVNPEFAKVNDGTAGLSCGYSNPASLGVDRWLAALACWKNISRQAVVVDAGSALTIDLLADNRHRGGYILPGLKLMAGSLGVGTWGVRVAQERTAEICPATDTSGAVTNGSLLAMVGAVTHAARLAGVDDIVLTGGDSSQLKKYLLEQFCVTEVPDLVLDGLVVALP